MIPWGKNYDKDIWWLKIGKIRDVCTGHGSNAQDMQSNVTDVSELP